jgi:hypothetical protein
LIFDFGFSILDWRGKGGRAVIVLARVSDLVEEFPFPAVPSGGSKSKIEN